jgi:hypothetical protein
MNNLSQKLESMEFNTSYIAGIENTEKKVVADLETSISDYLSKFEFLYSAAEINATELMVLKARARKQLKAKLKAAIAAI